MKLEEIIIELNNSHHELFEWIENQEPDGWEKGPEGKWTTGQHVLHLIYSSKALNRGMKYPKFLLQYKFGKSNRASRDYETIKNNYKSKLAQNSNINSPFNQNLYIPTLAQKDKLIKELNQEKEILIKRIKKWSYKNSIKYLLPHPLLGRMTMNEIWFWTAIHTRHHLETLVEKY